MGFYNRTPSTSVTSMVSFSFRWYIQSNPTNGYLIIDPLNLYNVIEVKSDGGSFMLHTIDVMKDTLLKTGYIDADEMHRNLRRFDHANKL